MRTQTPASDPASDPLVPSAAKRERDAWRRTVCVRSAVLCAILMAGSYALSHPTTLVARANGLRGRGPATAAQAPLETLVREVEDAATAGQHAEVARLCAAIVQQYPEHPVAEPAQVRLIQALIAIGDVDGVRRTLQGFRRQHPDSELMTEVLLDVASWQYESRDYVPAAQTYTDLVALVTNSKVPQGREDAAPSPIIIRSLSRWKAQQRVERGRADLERLARFNQALCYEHAGEGDAALRAYDRFVARFPQDTHAPEARFRVASLLLQQGKGEEALRGFRSVYQDTTAAVAFRCESLYRTGRYQQSLRQFDAAEATYRRALPLRPAANEFRLAALAELARLIEEREPMHALEIYRELAASSTQAAVRAVALQRLTALEGESAVATVHH